MKVSHNWLKDYVYFEETPEALADLLTNTGLEVEGVEKFESLKGNLSGVVTGHVRSCRKHPDAERLTLTQVDVGGGSLLDIVCGAPNVLPGQKVFVATVGTTLPLPGGDLVIKKAKIRGEESHGMICAEDELGIGTSHEGIMVLPDDTPVGMPASEYLGLEQDWVFEIGLTPNRIDAASHLGVARDIDAVLNYKTGNKKLLRPDISSFETEDESLVVSVTIEDPEACNRYCGLTISGLKVEDSPQWLKNRLRAIGQKPINNVVDITNYVMHELGQPLHAFDVANIEGRKVIVKKPPAGTRFITLEEEEIVLTGQDLMICNSREPMCMAGILGGLKSGVTANTTDVFLESAWFSPKTIRRSSNHHGIKTDSSFRFERGADPEMAPFALKRAALMIREIAGGKLSSNVIDGYPVKANPVKLNLFFQTVDRLIGKVIPREEITGILTCLDFVIHKRKDDHIELSVPLYRVDVTREADVAEEILRIYGYNNIDLPEKLHSSLVLSPKPDKEKWQNIIADMLAARGFYEIMNNSLTKGSYHEGNHFPLQQSVNIINPISQELNVMRQSLLFGGLETIVYNQNRRVQDMRLFEFGNVYHRLEDAKNKMTLVKGYTEKTMLALLLTGRSKPESWSAGESEMNFFDLKNSVIGILKRCGLPVRDLGLKNMTQTGVFAYSQSMLINGKEIVLIGMLSNQIRKLFDIKQNVFAGLIDWQLLLEYVDSQPLLYKEVAKFPEVRRDLALLINKEVSFADIEKLAFDTEQSRLVEVGLFDVYEDEKLGRDKKSYAVSFKLQDENKTLTDSEIDEVMERLSGVFSAKLGAVIR